MPSILYPDDRVTFIARKNFTWKGTSYKKGDDCPEFNDHYKMETFVRNGYVIPVVESTEDLPFQFRRTVMTRELAYKKLRMGNPAGSRIGVLRDQEGTSTVASPEESEESSGGADSNDGLEFNPSEHNVEEVLDYVENHPDEVLSVYALEESEEGKRRSTLLAKLDDILNKQAAEENEENPDV